MRFVKLDSGHMEAIAFLQRLYKAEIGEDVPSEADIDRLNSAVSEGCISFYGAFDGDRLVGCCSICRVFSTFSYSESGVFEDFYILPEYRHRGIARELVDFAFADSGVTSMTVGCADCDVEMYRALGFDVPLGNMLSRVK